MSNIVFCVPCPCGNVLLAMPPYNCKTIMRLETNETNAVIKQNSDAVV